MFVTVAGEPLPPEIEDWYFNVIGQKRCVLIDAWGQTGESHQLDLACAYLIAGNFGNVFN